MLKDIKSLASSGGIGNYHVKKKTARLSGFLFSSHPGKMSDNPSEVDCAMPISSSSSGGGYENITQQHTDEVWALIPGACDPLKGFFAGQSVTGKGGEWGVQAFLGLGMLVIL